MIYLDTHVVVWLFMNDIDRFSKKTIELLNNSDIYISPVVKLELQYLYEIKRINFSSKDIVTDLSISIGLGICEKKMDDIVEKAILFNWTRDPFDRMIVANASVNNDYLITKDKAILKNYTRAVF